MLLRSEAVASSRIEGLSVGADRLAQAELQEREPDSVRYDRRAAAVFGNIRAMDTAVASAADSSSITVETLRDVHRSLVEHTDEEPLGGRIRDVQNWVGGTSYSPLGATYVPPAPEAVPTLLDDLVAYANQTDVPPVVQAALCHSQFESIHPFVDGNGRTGRALIQIILMRSGVTRDAMPPISLALATDRKGYMSALAGMQSWVSPQQGHVAYNEWVPAFAGATITACVDRTVMEGDLSEMRTSWEESLGWHPRSDATVNLLLDAIQAMPYFTVRSMVNATGRTYNAVNGAISALVAAGIVEETTKGKRNRVFRAPQVIEEFEIVERRLASLARDTLVAKPGRPVPAGKPRRNGERTM